MLNKVPLLSISILTYSSSNFDFSSTSNSYANYIQGIGNRIIPRGEEKTYVTNEIVRMGVLNCL